MAGETWNGSNFDFAVVRYNTDGTIDSSFGNNGLATTNIGTGDYCQSVTIQSDGKIVVTGYSNNGSDFDFSVVRYNADGSLDNNFSDDGKIITNIGLNDYGQSVAIQSDDKIVVAGGSYNGSNMSFAIVRYNADGSLDNTFNDDGIITTNIGTSNDDGKSVAIQSNGKIVVAGKSYNGSNYDFAVVRYNIDGSLDDTFSGDGKTTTAIGSEEDGSCSVAIQSDGKIVAAGYSHNSISNNDFAIVRYNTDGSLDNTFSGDGKATTDINADHDYGYSVAIQPDGKIVMAGENYNGSVYDFAVIRYNADGSLDNTFSSDGIVTTAIEVSDDFCKSVDIQSDGKIVAAGYISTDADDMLAIVRYLPDLNIGVLDLSINKNDMLVYPNPLNENSILEYELIQEEALNIFLTDMQGKTIKTFVNNEKRTAGKHQEKVNISNNLPSGNYILTIQGTIGSASIKVVF